MKLTAEMARQVLDYNLESGELTWKPRCKSLFKKIGHWSSWTKQFEGKPALNNIGKNGYRHGQIFCKSYYAHRVIWLMQTGEWPPQDIDHIDGDRANNCWNNLRSVSRRENMRNAKLNNSNTSGMTGVSWHKAAKKWHATIRVDYENIYLGLFESFEAACEMRSIAERNYLFHENHGRA